jgi:hypothetical protein
MANWISRTRVGMLATLAAPLLLFGCAGIHLYDAGKDSTAKDVKTKYTELKLPGVIATEQQNLATLLEEELAVVREAHSLRFDLALLRIVDDDEPIGATITGKTTQAGQTQPNSFSRRMTELGYDDSAALRAFLAGSGLLNSRAEAVSVRGDLLYALTGRRAQSCGAPKLAKELKKILDSVTDILSKKCSRQKPQPTRRLPYFKAQRSLKTCQAGRAAGPRRLAQRGGTRWRAAREGPGAGAVPERCERRTRGRDQGGAGRWHQRDPEAGGDSGGALRTR